MKVCPLCNIACLEPHPELLWWRKCPICAFCELTPGKDPITRLPQYEAVRQIETLVQERFDRDTKR